MVTRRQLLATAAAATAVTLTAQPAVAASSPDTSTPEGWLEWIATHRHDVGLALVDGHGGCLVHRDRAAQPLASAIKVIHLVGYARAVARGQLDPHQQVRIGDWEAHYLAARHVPFPTDGGAHAQALADLGIPTDPDNPYWAADPDERVRLDDLVYAMITYSDNAVPDYLQTLLGRPALRQAAEAGGWSRPDLRSLLGEFLLLILPEYAPREGAPLAVRDRIGQQLARRFLSDADFAAEARRRIPEIGGYEAQRRWAAGLNAGSARQLMRLHHALASGDYHPREAGDIARDHLERPLSQYLPPGVLGIGFKGGSVPGALTVGMSVRRDDGTVGALGLLVRGVDFTDFTHADQLAVLAIQALLDPTWTARLAAALRD